MPEIKKRRYATIVKWLKREIRPDDPDTVNLDHKLSEYINGGSAAFAAFLNVLNNGSGFKQDGLQLSFWEAGADPIVSDILIAILEYYLRRNWKIT